MKLNLRDSVDYRGKMSGNSHEYERDKSKQEVESVIYEQRCPLSYCRTLDLYLDLDTDRPSNHRYIPALILETSPKVFYPR